jgi:exodeoxyribonuclease VII small subunit
MAAQEKKFEDELKDLEATVAQIDSGELSLEESIKAFERGVALVRSLNQKLDEVEKKIEVLVRDSQGELRTMPYRNDVKNEDDDLSS